MVNTASTTEGRKEYSTFHHHPEEIREAEVMKERHQDNAARHARVNGDLVDEKLDDLRLLSRAFVLQREKGGDG